MLGGMYDETKTICLVGAKLGTVALAQDLDAVDGVYEKSIRLTACRVNSQVIFGLSIV